MTRDLGERDGPGGRRGGPGVAAPGAAPRGAGEGEPAERSDEPFALLRAAIELREEPDSSIRARG